MNELRLCYTIVLSVKVTNIKTPQTQEDEFIEIQSETGTAFQRWTVRHTTMLQQVTARAKPSGSQTPNACDS